MSFEFKLIGGLTVRQFTYIVVSFLVALIFYFSGLPSVVSYPIIFFIVVIGLSMALITINGMPFSTWFTNFVFSLFTSQRKVYHKTGQVPNALAAAPKKNTFQQPKLSKTNLSAETVRLLSDDESVVQKLDLADTSVRDLDDGVDDLLEEDKFAVIDSYFNNAVTQSLGKYDIQPQTSNLPAPPLPQPSGIVTLPKVLVETAAEVDNRVDAMATSIPSTPSPVLEPLQLDSQPKPDQVSDLSQATSSLQEETKPHPQLVSEPDEQASIDMPDITVFNALKPNQIAGFVCDVANTPIANAQVSVIDARDNLLRSVYSDSKGKFIIPTPLPAGTYNLQIAAANFQFPDYKLELNGELVPMYRYLAKSV